MMLSFIFAVIFSVLPFITHRKLLKNTQNCYFLLKQRVKSLFINLYKKCPTT